MPVSHLKTLQTYSSALAAEDCLAGTFRYDVGSGELQWSDEIYLIHGYRRGDVVPTIGVLMSHKHPDDRKRCGEIFEEVCRAGGSFASYHRVVDARRRERRVLTAGEGVADMNGNILFIEGFILDLTRTLQLETDKSARDAVAGAIGARGVIEQAKGVLMGMLHIGSDAAFDRLCAYSQRHNIKIAHVAEAIVRRANNTQEPVTLLRLVHAMDGGLAASHGEDSGLRPRSS
jgi:ANTAR domain/PAS fold